MVKVYFLPQKIAVSVAPGSLLLDAARLAGISVDTPCDGAGSCGKCKARISVEGGRPVRSEHQDSLTQEEIDSGWVLACQTSVLGDVEVELAAADDDGLQILSAGEALYVAIDPWIGKRYVASADRTLLLAGGEELSFEAGDTTRELYGVAVDIGTTTLVSSLLDLRDGAELGVTSSLNPQALYAQDVLSRIKMGSQPEGLQKLHDGLIDEINRQIASLAAQAGVNAESIYEVVFSGNTTMLHLAVGINPASLGKFPYTLALEGGGHLAAQAVGLRIAPQALVYLPPIISAYVGPDITSGIFATRLAERDGITLFVDIGTNGEMALAVDGKLTATSTAAGPAFEGMNIACGMRASRGAVELVSLGEDGVRVQTIAGAEAVGICGSGLLDVVGELAAKSGLDRNGRFQHKAALTQPWSECWEMLDGKPIFRIAGPVYLTQKDVRQVQLAKGAIRAGVELLLKANNVSAAQVDRVLIAGSFGFHLRTQSLVNLGLLPPDFADRVEFVGNTSQSGAQAFLLNRGAREAMQSLVARIEVVELANDAGFERSFLQALQF
jgi:uncharacterized 2Fe-2S/4Fe-4S cluster protein (DUF4445 family)